MCGLIGAFGAEGLAPGGLRASLDILAPRGPDAEQVWQDDAVMLGHRRLAIIDLDQRSAQPMVSACGRYVIAYNGEVYNYATIRDQLAAEGVRFRTGSDTEVILEGYIHRGAALFAQLHGMFVFVIWDNQKRRAVVARDPYGIKPLYIGTGRQGQVVIGSQVRAILASGVIDPARDPAAAESFWLLGSVREPLTWYRDIRALPPGHMAEIHLTPQGSAEVTRQEAWFDIGDACRNAGHAATTPKDLRATVSAAVRQSIRDHMVADVPVGVFLSGGIDSATVAGLMAEIQPEGLTGITISYNEFKGTAQDESGVAARIAQHFGMRHVIRTVTREEFEADLPRILASMDQPSIDGINTWYASKAAAEAGPKAVMSGVGGDELFLGYGHFRTLPDRVARWKRLAAIPGLLPLARMAGGIQAWRSGKDRWRKAPDWLRSIEGAWWLSRSILSPRETARRLGRPEAPFSVADWMGQTSGAAAADPALALAQYESMNYMRHQLLRDSDWASMDHSVELRTPLVHAPLLMALSPVMRDFAAHPNKSLLSGTLAKPLPQEILNRPKTGFAIPVNDWIAGIMGLPPDCDAEQRKRAWMEHIVTRYDELAPCRA